MGLSLVADATRTAGRRHVEFNVCADFHRQFGSNLFRFAFHWCNFFSLFRGLGCFRFRGLLIGDGFRAFEAKPAAHVLDHVGEPLDRLQSRDPNRTGLTMLTRGACRWRRGGFVFVAVKAEFG